MVIRQGNPYGGRADLWLLHHWFWHPEVDDWIEIGFELARRGFTEEQIGEKDNFARQRIMKAVMRDVSHER